MMAIIRMFFAAFLLSVLFNIIHLSFSQSLHVVKYKDRINALIIAETLSYVNKQLYENEVENRCCVFMFESRRTLSPSANAACCRAQRTSTGKLSPMPGSHLTKGRQLIKIDGLFIRFYLHYHTLIVPVTFAPIMLVQPEFIIAVQHSIISIFR